MFSSVRIQFIVIPHIIRHIKEKHSLSLVQVTIRINQLIFFVPTMLPCKITIKIYFSNKGALLVTIGLQGKQCLYSIVFWNHVVHCLFDQPYFHSQFAELAVVLFLESISKCLNSAMAGLIFKITNVIMIRPNKWFNIIISLCLLGLAINVEPFSINLFYIKWLAT